MIFLIVKKPNGIRGQEYYGMAKGIATQSFFIPKLLRGERKIQLIAFGMRII